MIFNLGNYKKSGLYNKFLFPTNFFCHFPIDRSKYRSLEIDHEENGLKIYDTFFELRRRTGTNYFNEVYPAQSSALNFSESTFPCYRFFMPEVLTDDWLAIVDFHKKYSRDHALHQPLSAYIVYTLLGGGNSKKSFSVKAGNLLDLSVNQILRSENMQYLKNFLISLGMRPTNNLLKDTPLSREVWKNIFFETAMVAAIFHDLGYPWQYINRLQSSIKIANFNPNNLINNTNEIYEKHRHTLLFYPFNDYKPLPQNISISDKDNLLKIITSSLTKTHGFPGALGFHYLYELIRKNPDDDNYALYRFCVEWAALGGYAA